MKSGVDHVVFDGLTNEVVCTHCGRKYPLTMPIDIDVMVAICEGLSKKHEECEADPEVAAAREQEFVSGTSSTESWANGPDIGTSSMTIWCVLTGKPSPRPTWTYPSTPLDPSDFGRCYRLVKSFGWRNRLDEVSKKHPIWTPFVREWDRMVELYERDLPTGTCSELYDLMRGLDKESTLAPATEEKP